MRRGMMFRRNLIAGQVSAAADDGASCRQ